MSLINKMLQDLDARGTPAGDAFPAQIKPVEREPVRLNLRRVAAAVGGSLAGLALVWFGWAQVQQRQALAHAPVPAPLRPAAAAPVPAPAAAAPVAVQVPAAPAARSTDPAPAAPPADAAPAAPRTDTVRAARPSGPAPKSVEPLEPDSPEARAARQALAHELDARTDALRARVAALAAAPVAAGAEAAETPAPAAARKRARKDKAERAAERADATGAADAPATTRAANPHVRAESEYRRALASLQDGRMTEAVASLENALKIDPAHDAARQTLVGLLVEAGRGDEAMRQLQLGLSLDPRQPALAMLLARLQIEHGASGIDTLMRTLPYAGNDAEYRAFLAGALQRQGRHREAAEQYAAALRGAPGNAVWWMGLGMSLQADKRGGEALDAFQKARAAGLPNAELQTFVERRIQQLAR